jgi:hypothetical protein
MFEYLDMSKAFSVFEPLYIASRFIVKKMSYMIFVSIYKHPPRWWLHLIVVRGFEYARDPDSYTSGSIASGRASLAGEVKG